jgi:hypothetical protein
MDSKNFFTKIREIIREEIDYALNKKMNENKKSEKDILLQGLKMIKEAEKPKKVQKKQDYSDMNSINDILNETRRTLQESMEMDDEFHFTSDMAQGFGLQNNTGVIPNGYAKEHVPDDVMKALTRDYSALIKKMDEKKGR